MSNTKKAAPATADAAADVTDDTAAEPAPATDDRDEEIARLEAALLAASTPVPVDPRDQYIAELRAKLAGVQETNTVSTDPRDMAIAALKAEVEALRATPEGEANELRKALASLAATVERMQSGTGLVPFQQDPDAPPPFLYGGVLACGDIAEFQFPTATAHHCPDHGTIAVRSFFTLSHDQLKAARAR